MKEVEEMIEIFNNIAVCYGWPKEMLNTIINCYVNQQKLHTLTKYIQAIPPVIVDIHKADKKAIENAIQVNTSIKRIKDFTSC